MTADHRSTNTRTVLPFIVASVMILITALTLLPLIRQSDSTYVDSEQVLAESDQGVGDGYRWQLCTDFAMIDAKDMTSGAWTNGAYGVGDPAEGVFVTEVDRTHVGEALLNGFRTDPSGRFTTSLEGRRYPADTPDGWRPFVSPYAADAANELLPDRQRAAFIEFDRNYAPHHVDGLRTLVGVLDAFDLTSASSTIEVDRTGAEFLRFERPATGHLEIHPQTLDWGAQQLGYFNAVRGDAWVLDVWVGAGEVVQRIRMQTQESRRHWAELRFEEGRAIGELPGPAGPDRLGYELSCPSSDAAFDELGWMGFEPWDATIVTPVDATLDPSGRPYDATDDGGEVARQALGTIVATDGSVFVSDSFVMPFDSIEDIAVRVDFTGAPSGDIALDAMLLGTTSTEFEGLQVYGVRLDVPDTVVDRWMPFDTAYCGGGWGRISSLESLQLAPEFDDAVYEVDAWTGDLDMREGIDTVVFFNGWGDGCFPLSRGVDGDDNVVSLVVWHEIYPWRLMIPDGTPPIDVTEREDEIQDCLDGNRPIEAFGYCSSTPPAG